MSAEPGPAFELTTEAAPASRRVALTGRLLQVLPAREGAFWVFFALMAPKFLGPIFTIGLRRFLGPGAAGIFDLASNPYKFLYNFSNF